MSNISFGESAAQTPAAPIHSRSALITGIDSSSNSS